MVVVAVLAGVLVISGVGVVGLRRWATRVEHGPGDVPDRVHRLQRGVTGAVFAAAVLPSLVLVPAQSGLFRGAGGHDSRRALALVVGIALPLLVVGLIIAVTRAVRPSLVRLRGIESRPPHRWRRALVGALFGLIFGTLYGGLRVLVPGHGAGRAVGVVAAYAVALVLAQALLAPLWLVAFRARRLDPEIEQQLRSLATRLEVRVGGFRAFPGRSQKVANAIQVGLLPRWRYVLLSDYLLDHLTPAEVEAVVAHELGHARGHHLVVKLAGVAVLWGAFSGLPALIDSSRSGRLLLVLLPVGLPLALVLVQGLLGVQLERRADAAAARDVGPAALASALDRIATLNDTKRRTGRFWNLLTQHPGVEERVEALHRQTARASAPAG